MIKVATMFSGGLAAPEFALKYENIEHKVVFAAEFDKYARKQYLKFHKKPLNFYNDVRDIDGLKYKGKIDLLIYGSPCQDLSIAGKRKGFNGEKSSLFREGARIQKEIMPKNFIFENVKGLLSSNKGADYKEVCNTFRDMGYSIVTLQMNTKDYGVPQNRERIFIVGFLDENEYFNYKEPSSFELKIKLKDILEKNVDEKYFLKKSVLSTFEYTNQTKNQQPKILIKSATKKGYEIATKNDSINFTHPSSKTRRGRVGKEVAQTLDCACNQGVIKNYRIRRLTPKECFLLQGVKEEDIKLIVSNTQAYKIAGNAISVNVMQYLLKSLYKQEKIITSIFDF